MAEDKRTFAELISLLDNATNIMYEAGAEMERTFSDRLLHPKYIKYLLHILSSNIFWKEEFFQH